jgi:hypothetical protein
MALRRAKDDWEPVAVPTTLRVVRASSDSNLLRTRLIEAGVIVPDGVNVYQRLIGERLGALPCMRLDRLGREAALKSIANVSIGVVRDRDSASLGTPPRRKGKHRR